MSCHWTEKISLLIDGELEGEEARAAERHLDACAACRRAREDFLFLRREISSYRADLNPAAQSRALANILASKPGAPSRARLSDEAGARKSSAGWRERLAGAFGVPRLAPALAALLLFAVALAAALNAYRNRHEATPHEAAAVNTSPTPDSEAMQNEQAGAGAPRSAPPNVAEVAPPSTGDSRSLAVKQPHAVRRARAPRPVGGAGVRPVAVPAPSEIANRRTRPALAPALAPPSEAVAAAPFDAARFEREPLPAPPPAAEPDTTARHVEQAQLLLRSFRNARLEEAEGGGAGAEDLAYERTRSRKLLYRNIVLRREAANKGDAPVARVLDRLEPILIDIANLPDRPRDEDVLPIKERMRKKNIVALLQVSLASR